MDRYQHIAVGIFGAIFLKSFVMEWWERFKAREQAKPIPLKFRRGVYEPWGPVQRIQHYGWRATQFWFAYIGLLLAILAYTKIVGPIF